MTISRPTNIQKPFADAGAKNTIPVAATGTGKASFTDGFPPPTMLPISSGGIPPEGKDFNGIFYDITSHTLWVNAGGQYQFDAALSTAIGGYPAGMVLQDNAGMASYVSAVANNTTDFNSTPGSIGSLWLPYAGTAYSNITIATTGGTTTLTAIQATARFITVTGALIADANIVVPAALGRWTVINNTTGAFAVNVKTAAGTGVPIFQTKADTVFCDATNVDYDAHSSQTRTAGDSTKHLATTEFVTNAVGAVAQIGPKWVNKSLVTATGNFTVPAGVYKLRAYAIGPGAPGTAGGASASGNGGSGGGCAWGEIAVTPGQVIACTIDATKAQFGALPFLLASAGVGRTTPGTGTKDASVTNGGTATGGQGGTGWSATNSGGGGGGASGSPLGTGGNGGSALSSGSYTGGGGGWGGDGDYSGQGAGTGGSADPSNGPSASGGVMSNRYAPGRSQFTAYTDPLLAPCNSSLQQQQYTWADGTGGYGGNLQVIPGYGGGAGPCATAYSTGSKDGRSIFGGGAGGGYQAAVFPGGNAGYGGGGGGGSSFSSSGGAAGTGGPGCIAVFW